MQRAHTYTSSILVTYMSPHVFKEGRYSMPVEPMCSQAGNAWCGPLSLHSNTCCVCIVRWAAQPADALVETSRLYPSIKSTVTFSACTRMRAGQLLQMLQQFNARRLAQASSVTKLATSGAPARAYCEALSYWSSRNGACLSCQGDHHDGVFTCCTRSSMACQLALPAL